MFEIGVEYGNSSAYIAFGLECDDSKLYSVDIQDVRQYRPDNQVFYLDRSVNVTPPEKCAWAFIDGDHSFKGVVADIEHCLKLGIDRLVFHDARIGDPCPDGNGQKGTDVYAAATYLLKEPEWRLTFIDSMCDLLVAEREGA